MSLIKYFDKLGYSGPLLRKYWIYCLAHEISHAIVGEGNNHNMKFMNTFMEICPEELQFFELGYKPRAAKRAGIKG